MRLAAISDMHGNAVAFEAVIADLRRQSPDAVVCLGDVTMKGPQPKECVDLLRSLNPLACLRGNYDALLTRWPVPSFNPEIPKHLRVQRIHEYDTARLTVADQEWLSNLATHQILQLEGIQVELFHASPRSLVEINYPWASLEELCNLRSDDTTRLVIYGHIHHAFVRQARGVQVVNPGSVGFPFDGDNRASYAILDIEGDDLAVQLRRVTYDVEAAIQVARERSLPDLDTFVEAVRNARYPYA